MVSELFYGFFLLGVLLARAEACAEVRDDHDHEVVLEEERLQGPSFEAYRRSATYLTVTDKILVLRDGQMDAFGPRDEVLASLQKKAQGRTAPGTPARSALTSSPLN